MATFESLNAPLRDERRFTAGQPHPLPCTVAFLRDALAKLRQVAAQSAMANEEVILYRGMKDVVLPEVFLEHGGTELAPMSTTIDMGMAMQYAKSKNAVLLRLRTKNFMVRGPDISWASAFPDEGEHLFPPLSYLEPVRDANGKAKLEILPADDYTFQVLDVDVLFS